MISIKKGNGTRTSKTMLWYLWTRHNNNYIWLELKEGTENVRSHAGSSSSRHLFVLPCASWLQRSRGRTWELGRWRWSIDLNIFTNMISLLDLWLPSSTSSAAHSNFFLFKILYKTLFSSSKQQKLFLFFCEQLYLSMIKFLLSVNRKSIILRIGFCKTCFSLQSRFVDFCDPECLSLRDDWEMMYK